MTVHVWNPDTKRYEVLLPPAETEAQANNLRNRVSGGQSANALPPPGDQRVTRPSSTTSVSPDIPPSARKADGIRLVHSNPTASMERELKRAGLVPKLSR